MLGGMVHLRRPGRAAVAAQIDEVDVVTALGDVIHPGEAVQPQVEGGFGGIGRAVHVEQDLVGGELLHALRVLVAHVELDARVGRGHHELFHDDLRGLGEGLAHKKERYRENRF
jgi:hypothetical protein